MALPPDPRDAALPTGGQLRLSTLFAALLAALVLLAVVLPAERGVDPLGAGRLLGLTRMGETKAALAAEAAAERPRAMLALERRLAAVELQLARLQPLVDLAMTPEDAALAATAPEARQDRTVLTLGPKAAAELELDMDEGAAVAFDWTVQGGRVNFDAYGEPYDPTLSGTLTYSRGAGVRGDKGELVAAFAGRHGWSWRNRSDATVTLTLRTDGAYRGMIRAE
ncbi:hypothetical protein LPC08_17250 [Roseomonas sp. OT10]|uniref:hypothetical protein n=1 Tax=Roseomonas cutis TaxID=2897332 RepID=UPI001E32987C|nr:hypothetical protein [Roseomonas sp. OT10]UFN47750.1 hypothetical protein LPC08_17250 [Roseomonas sp. OT10]